MSDKSDIEWTDATWNPIAGCAPISGGCRNCYAMRVAARLESMGQAKYAGLTRNVAGKAVWTGKIAIADERALTQPLRWARGRRIFVNSMSDLFHANVPDETIDRVFAVMASTPQHTYQVLTKRAARMRAYLVADRRPAIMAEIAKLAPIAGADALSIHSDIQLGDRWPLPSVWLGVSVEDQATADERVPHLLDTPAAVRWISAEPLLGPVDFTKWHARPSPIGWIVVGGESGPDARPMHPDWAREIRDDCRRHGVPFFFKQWGEWAPGECALEPPTRTEITASWWADKWSYGSITVKASEELHRDDEPDLYRFGKRRAAAMLDGQWHREWPTA